MARRTAGATAGTTDGIDRPPGAGIILSLSLGSLGSGTWLLSALSACVYCICAFWYLALLSWCRHDIILCIGSFRRAFIPASSYIVLLTWVCR